MTVSHSGAVFKQPPKWLKNVLTGRDARMVDREGGKVNRII
jgi:hypothetical protein